LFFAENPGAAELRDRQGLAHGPRIGITRAKELALRSHLKGNPWVSRR
jgi:3-methyladenine DNA glycosylase Mpg